MSPSPPKHRDKSMRPSTSGWSKLTSRKYVCCQMLQVSLSCSLLLYPSAVRHVTYNIVGLHKERLGASLARAPRPFSYPEPFLRAVRRGALAKSITGYHKNMVRKQCPVLELANQMPVRNMDLARAPRRTARKKGSGYENAPRRARLTARKKGSGYENDLQ